MVDAIEFAASFVVGIVTGIVTGILIQNVRLKHELLIEKKKRLSPYLERASPIIDRICRHSDHAATAIVNKEKHSESLLGNLSGDFEEYDQWYAKLTLDGMIIELRSIDVTLSGYFAGLFTYAQNSSNLKEGYLRQTIHEISGYSKRCKRCLVDQLSK